MQSTNSKLNTILLIILIILVAAGIVLIMNRKTPNGNLLQVSEQENIPMDKQDQDSKEVVFNKDGYVPPQSQTTPSTVFSPLTTTYITAQNWPPKISKTTEEAACPGIPSPRTINGKTYCVSMQAQGAAGSIITDFTYRTGVTQITFTLRFSRCDNYDDPKKTTCEMERATFNPDQIIIDANI